MNEFDRSVTYSPMHEFYMMEDGFKFTPYLEIRRIRYELSRSNTNFSLARHEINDIERVSFCFIVNNRRPKRHDVSEILNLMCLAFWIHSPTELQLRHEFGPRSYFSRLMDRFQFNGEEQNKTLYSIDDLKEIKAIYKALLEVTKRRGRLHLATVYTYYGCTSIRANVAYSLYSIALESILSCGARGRITNTLATAFACIQADTKKRRDVQFRKFLKLYDFRSDIMHGRWVRRRDRTNLKMLATLSGSLRELWKVILLNRLKFNGIAQNDLRRRVYLDSIESGYVPPP